MCLKIRLSFFFATTLAIITCDIDAQPSPWGFHDQIPIEVQCLAFLRRQTRSLPIALEVRDHGPLTANHLARHHIIPANTLLRFFNEAVAMPVNNNNVVLSGIMNLMGFLADDVLNLYPDNADNHGINAYIRTRVQAMRNLQLSYVEDDGNPPLTILFSARMLVQSMFQWIPGNIFIGPNPQLRADDLGNRFEANARYIVGEEDYRTIVALNRTMTSFIAQPNYAEFNEVIELLSTLSRARHEPYPFDFEQWIQNITTGQYRIRRPQDNFDSRPRRSILLLRDYDPFCLRPLLVMDKNIKNYNLMIVAKAIDRVRRVSGFVTRKNYESWKDWYTDVSWSSGIYEDGLDMIRYPPSGYVFKDHSFAVGITGTDAKDENDNWVNLSSCDFRQSESPRKYAGQAIFDKNGRPVAIVITSYEWAKWGSGYSFVYVNGKWEYESTDSWDTRRFDGSSVSLDWHAPKFLID